jgi:hypothetical protein
MAPLRARARSMGDSAIINLRNQIIAFLIAFSYANYYCSLVTY